MKHKINYLSFGDKKEIKEIKNIYGVRMNDELDGTKVMTEPFRGGQLYVEYVIDITEAEYEDTESPQVQSDGQPREMQSGYEYRSMKSVLTTHGMGAVWFKYDIAPVKVHYKMFH